MRMTVSWVVKRRPQAGHDLRRRIAVPSSAARLSMTLLSGCLQCGQYTRLTSPQVLAMPSPILPLGNYIAVTPRYCGGNDRAMQGHRRTRPDVVSGGPPRPPALAGSAPRNPQQLPCLDLGAGQRVDLADLLDRRPRIRGGVHRGRDGPEGLTGLDHDLGHALVDRSRRRAGAR